MKSVFATVVLVGAVLAAPQHGGGGSPGWGGWSNGWGGYWHGGWGPPSGYGNGNGGSGSGGHGGSGGSSGAPTVTVKNGTVAGYTNSNYKQDFFLGVPFAQPPVGELRFRNPASINTTFNGTYEATAYAPECVGYGGDDLGYPISEDCLYLNVIRPQGYENEKLPVGMHASSS